MLECRCLQEGESDEFLDILCTVFQLDYNRAASIFYKEPYYDLGRKWALFIDGKMTSILTTTPMSFGFGQAIGIAGVATRPEARRKGYAQHLLECVLEQSAEREPHALLFAHESEVYRRVGFETLDFVVKGQILIDRKVPTTDSLEIDEVKVLYNKWASRDPDRLIRDEKRWQYWQWIHRTCDRFGTGYLCHEPSLCREALVDEPCDAWPVPPGSNWYGLKNMTNRLSVPLKNETKEMMLMGRNITSSPQMFMTDQF